MTQIETLNPIVIVYIFHVKTEVSLRWKLRDIALTEEVKVNNNNGTTLTILGLANSLTRYANGSS